MAAWSAENATNAYLHTLKSGNNSMQPDVAEFISALAAGSGSRLIVEVRSNAAGPTTLALVAAAQQTNGKVVCILPNRIDLESSIRSFSNSNGVVEFVTGDATALLQKEYRSADFVLVDCELGCHEGVFETAKETVRKGGVVVGSNAFKCGERVVRSNGDNLLPIGGGIRICRVKEDAASRKGQSQWVVKVDECTGEEHVYRITGGGTSRRKGIRA